MWLLLLAACSSEDPQGLTAGDSSSSSSSSVAGSTSAPSTVADTAPPTNSDTAESEVSDDSAAGEPSTDDAASDEGASDAASDEGASDGGDSDGGASDEAGSGAATDTAPGSDSQSGSAEGSATVELGSYFSTIPPDGQLPDGAACARQVLGVPSIEIVTRNADFNSVAGGPAVSIDGADAYWNGVLAPRITGDFSGTTEQVLRWGACKWGFDEDITRARAYTESTWYAGRVGDETGSQELCSLIGLIAPCPQSYGLLQVKGTVHEGTYPASSRSSAFGVDYAMAWLRACFEGSFTWLTNAGYGPGNEMGCVGTWFSGEWLDQPANDYIGEVRGHVEARSWEQLGS